MTSDKVQNGEVSDNSDDASPAGEKPVPSGAEGDADPSASGDAKVEEKPEWLDLLGSGSIMKKVVQEGEPDTRPLRLQKCVLNYELSLEDGTVVEKKEAYEINLGDCEVVQGLDLSIGLMNLHERAILKIAPRLAFGSQGLAPHIPANAQVIYDVELVSIQPEDDPENLTISERKLQGNKKRETGNWWYCRGENTLAIQCYRRALEFLDEVEGGISDPLQDNKDKVTDSALQNLLEDRISVCNNMAAAQIKLELYDPALISLQTVLRCQPNNVKALFRKAKVYKAKNDLVAAIKCLKKADEVSPNDADVQKEMTIIGKLIQKQKVSERELAKRMFSKTTAQGKTGKEKQARNNLMVWGATFAASVAIGLAGVAAYRLKYS